MKVVDTFIMCVDCSQAAINDDVSSLDNMSWKEAEVLKDEIHAALKEMGPVSFTEEVEETQARCNCCKRKSYGTYFKFSKFE